MAASSNSHGVNSDAKRSSSLRQVYPRRIFVTSMSQALIGFSLALSILTFVISLLEFLPMREGDSARQESLQYNTFICLILPLVVAYCSQSRVISVHTQQWILHRACSLKQCLSPSSLSSQLVGAFRNAASNAGLTCSTASTNFLSDPMHFVFKIQSGVGQLVEDSNFMNSTKLITTNLTAKPDKQKQTSQGAYVPEQLFSSLMINDQSFKLSEKPKCLLTNPNFDSISTETDTPQNEKAENKTFKFPAQDDDLSVSSSSSKRNSLQEERPAAVTQTDLSQLMFCHFGKDLNDQHKYFNRMFNELQKLGNQTRYPLESIMPLQDFFLPEYSSLEKILVCLNIVLFGASLSDENLDQEVGTAILYIMFSVAYFVTTTTCLSGANALKRKACMQTASSESNQLTSDNNESKSGLSISTPTCNFVTSQTSASANQKTSGLKKQSNVKRGVEQRKSVVINAPQSDKIIASTDQAGSPSVQKKQKRNVCTKLMDCVSAIAMTLESYALRLLRLSFFILNLVMLWLCIVNLN